MNARTLNKIRASTRRGARLLDKNLPGWEKKIKITKLQMDRGYTTPINDCGCILAQTHGEYARGVVSLQISWDDAATLGFITPADCNVGDRAAWNALAEAWKDEVRSRRGAGKA